MAKHNKKRNIGIIYELLLKHISSCLIEGKVNESKIATKILERRFAKGTEIYKEFRLFNALAQSTISDTHIVASILTEAKSAARKCSANKLNSEKSSLIHDINHKINDNLFYYRNVENYKELATIQLAINEWRKDSPDIKNLIEYEKKVGEGLLREKVCNNQSTLDASHSSKLIFKIMTEKINKKYGDTLTESEKDIIKNYALYGNGDTKKLQDYFKLRKVKVLNLLENFHKVENNKILCEKVEFVKEKILKLDESQINDQSIIKLLTLSKLISEMTKQGGDNV
mgnify:CR=1 FL=1